MNYKKVLCIVKYNAQYMFMYNKNSNCFEIPNMFINGIKSIKKSLSKMLNHNEIVVEKICEYNDDCMCLLYYCEIIGHLNIDDLNINNYLFSKRIPSNLNNRDKKLFKLFQTKIKDLEKENNYFFWKKYLMDMIKKLESLAREKEYIYIDLHMHSDYSIDSTQSLKQIIKKTQTLGFDIIAITDHDSIKVYDELYEYLKNNNHTIPIIIPGVEFTIDNEEYGSQFHILQLMINPKEESINENILYQEKASWIRAKKQIERLSKNKAMQYFFKKYNYNCSIDEYSNYLSRCYRPIPEYKTMMDYIRSKTYSYGISNWEILLKMEEYNKKDNCLTRKQIKDKEYKYLREKYREKKFSDRDERFFHRLLATRGSDDDFFPDYEVMGDLSVNKYNELKLNELNKKYITFFAHPSDSKLY